MGARNKKTQVKINLLGMSDDERIKIIEKVRLSLQQCICEAKLWKTLLQYETVTINGQVLFSSDNSLEGLTIQNNSKV